MDWTPSELQQAVAELAPQVLRERSWEALVASELLDLDEGLARLTLLVEAGAVASPVPVFPTLALGAPLRGRLPADAILSGGLTAEVPIRLVRGRLTGILTTTPYPRGLAALAVAADDGIHAVDPRDLDPEHQEGTDGSPLARIRLDGVPSERIGGPAEREAWLTQVHLSLAALQLGLCRGAIALTADHVSRREQFGVRIGTFQAVGQRIADAWIDLQAMELTLWSAAWQVSAGLSAARAVRIARYTASERGHRIVAACQHLHGGTGFDRDYPLHRHFLAFKLHELMLGGASDHLEALGDLLAADAAGVAP